MRLGWVTRLRRAAFFGFSSKAGLGGTDEAIKHRTFSGGINFASYVVSQGLKPSGFSVACPNQSRSSRSRKWPRVKTNHPSRPKNPNQINRRALARPISRTRQAAKRVSFYSLASGFTWQLCVKLTGRLCPPAPHILNFSIVGICRLSLTPSRLKEFRNSPLSISWDAGA